MRAPDQLAPASGDQDPPLARPDLDEVEARLVGRLARRLRRSDPLRGAAENVLAGQPVPPDRVPAILGASQGWGRTVRRAVAVWLLGLAPLDAADRLRALAAARRAHVGDARRTGRQIIWASLGAGALAYAGVMGTAALQLASAPVGALSAAGIVTLTLVAGLFPAAGAAFAAYALLGFANATVLNVLRRSVRSLAMRTLGRLRDLDSLPELAMTVCDPGRGSLRQGATQALLRLLPTLTPEDAPALPFRAVPELGRVLVVCARDRRSPELSLAVLNALLNVGDGRAFAAVQHAAHRDPRDGVRSRALQVLPVIEERLRAAQSAQVLLRPAGGPEDAAAVLLRPAGMEPAGHDVSALLRPAGAEPAAKGDALEARLGDP